MWSDFLEQGIQIQSSRDADKPGFLSYWAENASSKYRGIPGEGFVCGPQGLDLGTPALQQNKNSWNTPFHNKMLLLSLALQK